MNIFYTFSAVIVGVIVGSFLNVCIYRIPLNISIITGNSGRSMCTSCKHTLKGYDLIPVLSWVFLRGRCRYCGDKISARYPMVEAINAILWGACIYNFGLNAEGIIYSIFCSVLLVLSMIDIDIQEIPYRMQVIILILAFMLWGFSGFEGSADKLLGLVAVSIPMAIITIITGGFGGGDIQLVATSGLLLGLKNIIFGSIVGIILGGIAGIVSLLLIRNENSNESGEKRRMPFGPFLSAGMVISIFFGEQIVNWYIGFF